MHLNSALTVSNVMQFLFSEFADIGQSRGQIILGHMLEGKLPEPLIFIWVVLHMFPGVLIPSVVTHPDVISHVS